MSDKEPKYGLAVTGLIDPGAVRTKGGGHPGDVLVLTKALGTGVITTALKSGIAANEHVQTAVASMKTLNRQAAEAAQLATSHAVTDITGFGLLGMPMKWPNWARWISASTPINSLGCQVPWFTVKKGRSPVVRRSTWTTLLLG